MKQTRQTRQKEILEDEMRKIDSFFSAEDLFERIKKKDRKIGIATIYRFLNYMAENGILHSYLCNKKTIYSSGAKNHCHFVCQKCGKTDHFSLANLNFIKKIPGDICHFQIDVEGICVRCKR